VVLLPERDAAPATLVARLAEQPTQRETHSLWYYGKMMTMSNRTFSGDAFQPDLHGFALEARRQADRLHRDWQAADELSAFWQTLMGYLAKGWVCHVKDHLDQHKDRLRQWRSDGHPAIATIENLYREVKTATDQAMVSFPGDLERACLESNLPIDRTSREPHYTFQNGFLELDIDTGKRLAHLTDREAKLVTVPADVGAVVEAASAELQRLFHRPFDGEKFLRKLRLHYLAVIKKEGIKDGDVLPIRRITHRLGKNEKGFRTDEFVVDLSKLAEVGPLQIDDVKLDLQQTKDTNQGMLLYGVASRGYVGFIVFRKT
jgi:hypothetical protein